MSNGNGPVYSNLEILHSLLDPTYKPKPLSPLDREAQEQAEKFRKLLKIRDDYKWEWSEGAKYLYLKLIEAYGLNNDWRKLLLEMAKPKPGRKHSVEQAVQIALLRQQGMTAKQIAEQLSRENRAISVEAVESYLKRRRKPSIEEEARAAVQRAFRRGKSPGDCSR